MQRIKELDGLRGFAAVLVVLQHLWPSVFFFGWAAVDLFFVLSGYLITRIILDNRDQPGFLKAFYARRSLRIWPIYFLTILALLIVTHPERGATPYYTVYLQNIPLYWGWDMPVWHEYVHTWTLALEEQFYVIWPALLLLVRRRSHVVVLALGISVLAILGRSMGAPVNLLGARCDGFAMGGLLAGLLAGGRNRWVRWAAAVAGLAAAATIVYSLVDTGEAMWHYRPLDVAASTLLSFALVAAVCLSAGKRMTAFLRVRLMVYLGTISYGLYLYHYPILLRGYSLSLRLGIHGTVLEPFLFGLLSLCVAIASWHLIERPILSLKDRFPYRKSRACCAPNQDVDFAEREEEPGIGDRDTFRVPLPSAGASTGSG